MKITGFRLDRSAVRTYELLELAVGVEGSVAVPGRSALAAIDGEFVTPSGRLMRVPAFHDGQDWRIRFAGSEPGEYSSTLVLQLGGKETARIAGPAFVLASGGSGHVRRAKASRYLEFDDGSPYLPVGQNVSFTTAKTQAIPVFPDHDRYVPSRAPLLPWEEAYTRWFGRMAGSGANWARFWLASPDFDLLDGQPWQFNPDHARHVDRLFDLASQNGIYICLCLENFRTIFHPVAAISTDNWFSARDRAWGRLLVSEGGREHADLFTTPAIEELLGDLIRYCVARWGWRSNLFAWELWNEIECLIHDTRNEARLDWIRRATRRLRQADPWGHLVKSSGHHDVSTMLRGRDFGDLNDVHMYFGWMGTETAKDLARLIQDYAAPLQREDYPFIVGECGLAREVNTPEYGLVADLADRDTAGVALHEVLWAGLFIGGAGTGMTWWWDEHVDLNDQYHQFRGISRFVRDVPWNREPFRHVVVAAGCNLNDLRAWELRGDRTRLVWIQSMHYNWWNVIHGARLSPIKNAWIVLEDARPGRYELEWWDTATGEITGRSEQMAEGGRIMIAVPDFTTDLALKVRLRD